MPSQTQAKVQPRRRFRRRRVNPAKKVQEWELTRLRNSLKRMMPKPEWKTEDVTATNTVITTTATIVNLIPIAQGDTDSDRTGDKITLRSLFLRLSLSAGSDGSAFMRFLIVQDKQNNASAPTATDILQSPTNYLSPLNDDFGKRFKVRFDRIYSVDNDANGLQVDKVYRKLRVVVEYPGTGTVPNTNGMYLVALSGNGAGGPNLSYYTRFRYTDA